MLGNYTFAQDKITVDTNFREYPDKINSIEFKTNNLLTKEIYFYTNGKKSVEINYKKGIRDGITFYYHKNGQVESILPYANSKLDGEASTFSDSAKKLTSIFYKDGVFLKKRYYYKSGAISQEINYEKEEASGINNLYYENGKLKYTGAYKNGRMDGERTCYNDSGKPVTGNYVSYFENGKIEREGTCINGKPDGVFKVYFSNGDVRILVNFKDGKPDGLTYYYNKNKSFRYSEEYSNGKFVKEVKGKK